MTLFPAGHKATASDFATLIPLKGVRITNTGSPIASTSGTTELDMSKYAMTGLSLTTGRYYVARYQVTLTRDTAGDGFTVRLRTNTAVSGTQIGDLAYFSQEPTVLTKMFEYIFVGSSTYTALYLSLVRTSGIGTASYYGTSGGFVRSWGALYDVGDSDNWADVT